RASGISFFQAEGGIRAFHVSGVQTCALPISLTSWTPPPAIRPASPPPAGTGRDRTARRRCSAVPQRHARELETGDRRALDRRGEIGRASCREGVWRPVAGGARYTRDWRVQRW